MADLKIISYDPAFSQIAQASKERNKMLADQKAEQTGLFDQFDTIRGGQESLLSVYNRANEENGINDIKNTIGTYNTQIASTKGLLDSLDEDITSRTKGTFTTDAQRNRMVAAEGADLRTQLGRLGSGLDPFISAWNMGNQAVGDIVNLTSQDQERAVEGVKMRLDSLPERFAREMSGFNINKENELATIMDKLKRDQTLATSEWERLSQLEAEARDYERQQNLMRLQASLDRQTNASANSWSKDLVAALTGRAEGASTAAPSQQDVDSQYLGRLMSLDPNTKLSLIASLRNSSDPTAQRRFQLGKELGYWKY